MNDQVWWFVARSTGLVAYVLLGVAVIGGLLLSARPFGRTPPPEWTLDWHRFVGALSVVFTAVHLFAIYADSYIEFGLDDLFVPFASEWRPVAVGLGVLALYLLLAVEITSLLRRRLSRRLWRRVHYLSVPTFALSTAHLLMAGDDASNSIVLLTVGGLIGATVLLLGFRIVSSQRRVDASLEQRDADGSRRPVEAEQERRQ
ncbi:MAG: ferric reductase-like transmembrane domain-containing protein [Actinomycetota bacterium]